MNTGRVVLATRNAGKIRELAETLRIFGLEVLGLDRFPDMAEVEETGTTFEENARLKATAAALHTGLIAVADDSGLETDALNGAPGVYSARFAELHPLLSDMESHALRDTDGSAEKRIEKTSPQNENKRLAGQETERRRSAGKDARNIRALLAAMQDIPEEKRAARVVCAICARAPSGAEFLVRGVWEGRILRAPRGENGFGYDPVFFDPELGRSAAELAREEKNARSHRGKALEQLLDAWPAWRAASL